MTQTATVALIARKTAAVARGVGTRGIYATRAENSLLWDAEGRRFIDFAAGIAMNNTGHRHPRVMAAVAEQAQDAALLAAFEALPGHLEKAAAMDWPDLRAALMAQGPALILGRGPSFALACEAALKLKETCAIHAEAYSSAEVMHGPIEIVTSSYTTLCLTAPDAAEQGLVAAADQLASVGAKSFVTSSLARSATNLAQVRTGHPLTDPLPLIVTLYATLERLSRDLGRNPDKPLALQKVTQTV
jgi:glutamine---fructose-6-phosphate transaminase (isomerizing)